MRVVSNEHFHSRRSPAVGRGGMVASSQPLATAAGVRILDGGGTAADAAVAVAAALQVTQACSTGLGGDVFWLYYDAGAGRIYGANGSGCSPAALTLEIARETALNAREETPNHGDKGHGCFEGRLRLPRFHAHTVTVPGAPAAWQALLERFGVLSRAQVVAPAIALATNGFPVAPLTAGWWHRGVKRQLCRQQYGYELMAGLPPASGAADSSAASDSESRNTGRGPHPGEVLQLPTLAWSLRQFAEHGADAFYRGDIAERIVEAVRTAGGLLSMADLANHETRAVEPIGIEYQGATVWECPPNGQGLAALVALGVFREYEAISGGRVHSTHALPVADYHTMIEAMRFGFAAAAEYVADPETAPVPISELLAQYQLAERAALIRTGHRIEQFPSPAPGKAGDDTVYFCTADRYGNVCSFINSNFVGFGTGIVPRGCGFALQNRGQGFVLEQGHRNTLAPRKRPYHTIIPGMITAAGGGITAFGVMGGMMQPQGHLQTAVAMLRDDLDPQAALDRPRFQLSEGEPDGEVLLEDSLGSEVVAGLQAKGHRVRIIGGSERAAFGLGAIITRTPDGTLWGGADPRGDGVALPAV